MPPLFEQLLRFPQRVITTTTSFKDAIESTPIDSSTCSYRATIPPDWCFGLVPHGGFLASLLTRTVSKHFTLRHPARDQPDPISCHTRYLNQAKVGSVDIHIYEIKLGKHSSTVRAQICQSSNDAQDAGLCVEAYITQGNLQKENVSGLPSLPTKPRATESAIPDRKDCVALTLTDTNVAFYKPGWTMLFPPESDLTSEYNMHPQLGPSVRDTWFTLGEPMGIFHLGFLSDFFHPVIMNYEEGKSTWLFSTSQDVEVLRQPPAQGWDWLYGRMELVGCVNGRSVLEITFWDEGKNVVALAKQQCIILPVKVFGAGSGGTATRTSKL